MSGKTLSALKKVNVYGIIILLIMGSCRKNEESHLEGAWKLIEANWVQAHIEGIYPGQIGGSQIKFWSKEHFAFAGSFILDTLVVNNLGAGTYDFDGYKYLEIIDYQCSEESIGRTYRLSLEIINDTLIQKWPVDENWKLVEKYNMEKYIRIE